MAVVVKENGAKAIVIRNDRIEPTESQVRIHINGKIPINLYQMMIMSSIWFAFGVTSIMGTNLPEFRDKSNNFW